jgi:hypothetical protein
MPLLAMDGTSGLKIIAGIIFYSLFIFQMYNAIITYLSKPTIEQRKWMNFEDLSPKPLITICKKGQFDEERAKELGYRNPAMFNFLQGTADKKLFEYVLSWGGHINMTFDEMLDRIYGNDTSNVSVVGPSKGDYDKVNFETVFLINLGKCLQLSHYKPNHKTLLILRFKKEDFENNETYSVLITDPFDKTMQYLGEDSTTGEKITITKEEVGYSHAYSVQIENIQKISNCNSYIEESKSECIANAAWNDFGKNIGCLPPWLRKDTACNGFTKPVTEILSITAYTIKAYDAMLGYKLYTDKCLTACTSNKINLAFKRTMNNGNSAAADVLLKFDENIQVSEENLSYNEFTFIVEVGSALGLWIGYSAMDLFSLSIGAFQKLKDLMLSKNDG